MEVHAAAADSTGQLVVTGRYRTSLEGGPAPAAGSLHAELTRQPRERQNETLTFLGQADQTGRWQWAQSLQSN